MTDLPPPAPGSEPRPSPADAPTTRSIGPVERNGWVERPWAARCVGAVAYLIPFVASVAAAFTLSSMLPVAPNVFVGVLRWLGIAAVSTAVLIVVERQTRRLMPLRTLLGLTLAFPDKAPSRFKIAIRTGTTNQLRERLDEARRGRLGDTPSEAAERLLELVGMLSQHDRLTRGHSERVRAYSHMIGAEMGLSGKDLDRLRWAGLLHDVGKLAISPEILNKPGKLTAAEFEVVKTHPMEGKKLVEPLAGWLGEAARAVWEHHERVDGGGYPQGLAGTEISQAARIVSVADVFDVMTSIRSYKAATSAREAREELARCAGTQFDPVVVRAFLALSMGKVRKTMGPLSWVTQLAFLPGAIAAQAGPALATAAVVTAGAAASTVGIVVDPAPAIAERQEFVATVESLGEPLELPSNTVIIGTELVEPTGIQPTANDSVDVIVADPQGSDSDGPIPTTVVGVAVAVEPGGAATSDTTTSSIEPDKPATTTTTTTTTTMPPTTTTTIPPLVGEDESLYLLPGASGDQASQWLLPFGRERPADGPLFNYDTDRDDFPGLLIAKDDAGVASTDPTTVQRFRTAFSSVGRLDGEVLVELDVAAKDFAKQDIHVEIELRKCDTQGSCGSLGIADRTVQNADRLKKVIIELEGIDAVFQVGDTLELRIAILDDSEGDAWLAFGTRDYDARVRLAD